MNEGSSSTLQGLGKKTNVYEHQSSHKSLAISISGRWGSDPVTQDLEPQELTKSLRGFTCSK